MLEVYHGTEGSQHERDHKAMRIPEPLIMVLPFRDKQQKALWAQAVRIIIDDDNAAEMRRRTRSSEI
jgi:hypothetical protein